MELVLQNPQASAPLRVRVDLECNTPRDKIFANVLANSKDLKRTWVKLKPAHNRVAILVGNGPSLADSVADITHCTRFGADIFALNGACKFLTSKGIEVDYQVILDAQPETITLLGDASCYLLASQVDPTLFAAVPDPVLWQASYGKELPDEQPGFNPAGRDYCVIGAAASVGSTALPLLFALGYRQIKVFGLDSSNKGEITHARPQSNNDNDIYTFTHFRGKTYTSSLTMKLQAETFVRRGHELEAAGCIIEVFGYGLMPDMWNAKMSEREKYEELWKRAEYRQSSPGERAAKEFVSLCHVRPSSHVIDLGCGTGRGGDAVQQTAYCKVTLMDFVQAVDPGIELPFVLQDITAPVSPSLQADFVYCTDVMEHIPPPDVDAVIQNALRIAPTAFFQISLVHDSLGELIGQELHLSVHSAAWWKEKFLALGYQVPHCHDLGDAAQYVVTR